MLTLFFTSYFLLIFVLYVGTFHFNFVKKNSVQFNFFDTNFSFYLEKTNWLECQKTQKKIVPICFWLPMRRKKQTELLKTENVSYFLTAPPPY
jgi:hypothetical protein